MVQPIHAGRVPTDYDLQSATATRADSAVIPVGGPSIVWVTRAK